MSESTVLEMLQCAQINFENLGRMGIGTNPMFMIAMMQLRGGIAALEIGLLPNDTVSEEEDEE